MARTNNLTNFLTDVADSIREKTGKTEPIACEDFDTEIESISGGGSANLQTKSVTISTNGTTNITPDTGYDGMSSVSVTTNVPTGGDVPTKGVVFSEWTDGYPYQATLIGYTIINDTFFATATFVKSLRTITFSNSSSLSSIGSSAFYYLNDLTTIIGLENTNVTSIGDNTFYYCRQLVNIALPNTLQTVGQNAFRECIKMELTSLPDSITTLGSYAFGGCNAMTISKLPNSLQTLTTYALSYCRGITTMDTNLFSSLIVSNVFYYCTGLVSVVAPNITGIYGKTIYNSAFGSCTSLKAVWLGSSVTSNGMGKVAFGECPKLTYLYINLPRATVETFTNYQYGFCNDASRVGIIICNDDAGWKTEEEFRAIDWATYTE